VKEKELHCNILKLNSEINIEKAGVGKSLMGFSLHLLEVEWNKHHIFYKNNTQLTKVKGVFFQWKEII
jgi:hypothetical protein